LKDADFQTVQQCDAELLPLQEENRRLKGIIAQLKQKNNVVQEDNEKLFVSSQSLRLLSEKDVRGLQEDPQQDKQGSQNSQHKCRNHPPFLQECENFAKQTFVMLEFDSFTQSLENAQTLKQQTVLLQQDVSITSTVIERLTGINLKLRMETQRQNGKIQEQQDDLMRLNHEPDTSESRKHDFELLFHRSRFDLLNVSEEKAARERDAEPLQQIVNTIRFIVDFSTVHDLKDSLETIIRMNSSINEQIVILQRKLTDSKAGHRKTKKHLERLRNEPDQQAVAIQEHTGKLTETEARNLLGA
jgi:hypothetical protein